MGRSHEQDFGQGRTDRRYHRHLRIFLHWCERGHGHFFALSPARLPLEVPGGPGVLYAALVLNELAFATLGGYLAALLARHDELLNGGLSSFLRLLEYGFLTSNSAGDHAATVRALLFPFGVLVCAALGGYLRLLQRSGSRS
jgi:hypothetical protein